MSKEGSGRLSRMFDRAISPVVELKNLGVDSVKGIWSAIKQHRLAALAVAGLIVVGDCDGDGNPNYQEPDQVIGDAIVGVSSDTWNSISNIWEGGVSIGKDFWDSVTD